MGTYLTKPNTEKESHEGEDEQFKFGVSAMQGWRVSMEDAHSIVMNVPDQKGKKTSIGFFGVFDGHGGKEVALFAAKYLTEELVKTVGWREGKLDEGIQQAYLNLDAKLRSKDTWQELSNFARLKNPNEKSSDEMGGAGTGNDDLTAAIKNALVARFDGLDPDDPNWDGDDFEDPPFDPMVALDDGRMEDISDMDVMTRDDSEGEDEQGSGDLTGHEDEVGSESSDEKLQSTEDPETEAMIRNLEEPAWHGPSAGCTAVVAIVAKDLLVVANAGDSRCIASRNGTVHAMTHDHKPTDDVEAARIAKAGGYVTEGRVNGSLNLSRALGDMEFKRSSDLTAAQQMITANPEVRTLKLQPGDEFLILACDGIWDVVSNQGAVDFVRERLLKGMTPKAVCEALCDHCLAPDVDGCGEGCDNMSAMIVLLKNFASQETLNGASIPSPPWAHGA